MNYLNELKLDKKVLLLFLSIFSFIFVFCIEFSNVKKDLDNKVKYWESDINYALVKKDWVSAAKYVRAMITTSVSAADLVVDGNVIFSTKSDLDINKCLVSWVSPLKQYQVEIGEIKSCPNIPYIGFLVLKSPVFIFISFLSILFIVLGSSIALLRYKKGVLKLIGLLSDLQAEENASILEINKKQITESDEIVAKTISLMQSLFKERIEKEAIKNSAMASKRINLLVASFAHDIRSPLTALKIASEADPNRPGVKEIISLSSNRINALAEQLLESAKGGLEVASEIKVANSLSKINLLAEVVECVLKEKKVEFVAKPNISLRVSSTLTANDLVIGDKIQLQRMLSNLINNSVEALPNEKGNIVIHLSVVNQKIEMLVCDDGVGIPPTDINKVGTFGYSYGKNLKDSNGMGLFFAQKLISECGGSFEITSELSHGTIIKIQFPKITTNQDGFSKIIGLLDEGSGT